ncbi:MAG: hypothetical protein CMI53_04035 [Parcubacteria group bacterium]|nr:hypothetical protein [Parcubacteria group bacterium]|tara:strand:+ start:1512 stop:1775 length:264 start_codon:yes stop_codon:yes gene_type:complete
MKFNFKEIKKEKLMEFFAIVIVVAFFSYYLGYVFGQNKIFKQLEENENLRCYDISCYLELPESGREFEFDLEGFDDVDFDSLDFDSL